MFNILNYSKLLNCHVHVQYIELLNYWIIEYQFNISNEFLNYWIIVCYSIYWKYWNYWIPVQYIEIIEFNISIIPIYWTGFNKSINQEFGIQVQYFNMVNMMSHIEWNIFNMFNTLNQTSIVSIVSRYWTRFNNLLFQ